MTEPKPVEQYAALELEHTIDEQSRQEAMAKALIDNRKRQREQACSAEIDATVVEILKRHKCAIKFMEIREGGQTTKMWLQPVAMDDPPAAPG